jgi:hypothetical protein
MPGLTHAEIAENYELSAEANGLTGEAGTMFALLAISQRLAQLDQRLKEARLK